MNRRILAFTATSSTIGGVATWLDHFADHCGSNALDLTVALVQGQQQNDPFRYRQFHPNLNTLIVDGRGFNRESRIRACQRAIRKAKPDIVLPLGVLDANPAAIREKRRRAFHLVGRAQGNLPEMLADLGNFQEGIDHVICVGAMTRQYLIKHANFDSDRVTHIPNGAREASHPHQPSHPNAPLRLGYIGRMTNVDKRVMDIPILCQKLIDNGVAFTLTIAGSGPCELQLKEQCRFAGEKVRFVGNKTSDQIYESILPNLDVLLLFSSSETFGIVLAEAMMNGVVPVTSEYIGFQSERLVVDGVHGRSFPVGNMDAAAEKVIELYNNPRDLTEFSARGRNHATSHYNWQRCMHDWSRVVEHLCTITPIVPPDHLAKPEEDSTGRLEQFGLPIGMVDWVRRTRRLLFGPTVPAGGMEWPLYSNVYTPQEITVIEEYCRQIEVAAARESINDG